MSKSATVLRIEEDGVTVPASAFQLEGFRAWLKSDEFPERMRATFVEGELIIDMSPEATESHNKVKTRPRLHIKSA